MANSVPAIQQEMLDAIGVTSIEELFAQIPRDHRLARPLDLPPALSERELRRHITDILARNTTTEVVNGHKQGQIDKLLPWNCPVE
ncbi:hypothetical protein A6U98_03160 [Rhizobium sp. WYCCWR10014]|nr:hypothetical protein A6U98_03160 [Rhizobium sp. WYCCWR10014]